MAEWWGEPLAKAEFEKVPPWREADLSFEPSDLEEDVAQLERSARDARRESQGSLQSKLAKLKADVAPTTSGQRRRRRPASESPLRGRPP